MATVKTTHNNSMFVFSCLKLSTCVNTTRSSDAEVNPQSAGVCVSGHDTAHSQGNFQINHGFNRYLMLGKG